MAKRKRKPKVPGFTFKLDEKLLEEMAREHAQEKLEEREQRDDIMKMLVEQIIRGPVFKGMKLGLPKRDITLLLCGAIAAINAKSEEDCDRVTAVFARAFLSTLSDEELKDFRA